METTQESTVELSGIGTGMNGGMLMNMFRTYGPILRVTHNGTNSAQVVFAQKNHAMHAVEATNGAVVYGKTLKSRLQRPFAKVNQPCRGFAAGICRKGDMCKYQHVTDTAAFAPPTVKNAKREPKKKTIKAAKPVVVSPEIQAIPGKQVCRHFSRGYCSQGAECSFAHVLGLPKPTETASTEKTTRPCLFFQSGVCTRGDACRFAHVPKAAPVKTEAKKDVAKKTEAKKTPAKKAVVKKTPAKKAVVQASEDEGEAEPDQSQETRTCVECEKPGMAVWKCVKCDNSLYCDDCNSAVHSARVMAKHKRAKLPPVPTLPRCGECESKTASVRCEQCEVPFCTSCDASVHKFKSLRKHVRVTLSAKSEKTKLKVKEEPKPAQKKVERIKQEVEFPTLPKVANHVSYVESVPQVTFSSDSESEDEAMPEASSAVDEDESIPAAAGSDTETEDDFEDVKVPVTSTPVVEEPASESDSDDDFDDKPTVKPTAVPASVPKTELSSDSDSSDDEPEDPTHVANPAPKMELSSDSESDDSEDEAPAKPATIPASKPTLEELSSESDDSDDEASPKPVLKSTPKPVTPKPVVKLTPKPVAKKAPSKSSASNSSSSDSEDEAPPAKPAAKPTPTAYRAPVPARSNKASGISDGSSHTLVKKIEAFNQSGEGHEIHLDANLNGFERLLAHDCAERLGLAHESVGTGLERHIIISRPGSKRPATDSSSGHKAKKSKHQ